jgi:putative peptidoglycan lipid II flippase
VAKHSKETSRSLARGAAIITVATAASRITGFVRVVVVAAALGTTFLANTYQTANTAPNVVFELVAAGVLTSVFVPTFVEYLVKGRKEEGWDAANALASVALVALVGLAIVVALAAPLIMWLLTLGVTNETLRDREIALGATFLRLFSPQIALYGAGMIMTGALHAHRRFALAAVAPIFNNLVVIVVYLTYAAMRGDRAPTVDGITTGEMWVLGAGTTLGVVAMTICLIPQLTRLGWRARFRFKPSHPAVRRGARLGAWALGYAGGYQAGLIVVLLLANGVRGGVAAYQWAYTFFYLPHALFAIPVFQVLFTAMSEHAARGEEGGLVERLRDGVAMLSFLLIPTAAIMLAAAHPITRLTLEYGVMTGAGSSLVARVLAAFAVGLPLYSAFLVYTRAYYSLGDTKIPALVNAGTIAVASLAGATLFAVLPREWAVPGLALGHSIGFGVGAVVLGRLFHGHIGSRFGAQATSAVLRATLAAFGALVVMLIVRNVVPDESRGANIVNALLTIGLGAGAYLGAMIGFKSPELQRIRRLVRTIRSRR